MGTEPSFTPAFSLDRIQKLHAFTPASKLDRIQKLHVFTPLSLS